MAYLAITDFKFGMDRRRPRVAGVPGTLWTLENAFLSRGGDVVRAKKFVSKYSLPAGTVGLASLKSQLFVFGSGAASGSLPFGVQYQQLAAPSTPTLTKILDAKAANGKIYTIAEYDDGNVYHFYDAVRVTDWDAIGDANSSYSSVASALAQKVSVNAAVRAEAYGAAVSITARVPGTAFTCTAAATDVDTDASAPTATRAAVTANVAGVTEVLATGTVTVTAGTAGVGNAISQVTVNGVNLLSSSVRWVSSHTATAAALAAAINNYSATSGYSASSVGAVVTISAAVGTGTTPNGYIVAVFVAGTVIASKTDMTGGVAAVAAVAQVDKVTIAGGTYDATDCWQITVNGTTYKVTGRASGTGKSILVNKRRIYSAAGSLLYYCKISTFTDWSTVTTPATDSGFINLSTETEGAQELVGAVKYNGYVAIFAKEAVLIYALPANADNNEVQQVLENTGAKSNLGVISYGNTDVFYLDDTGIRSIRSRAGYNAGYVSDVGSAIDVFVQGLLAANGVDTVARAQAIVEASDGRYLLAIGNTIVGLSYFPGSNITAWSYLSPGYTVDGIVRAGKNIFLRSGDTIYLYGGDDGTTYPSDDESIVTVETPFMSANDPAGIKDLTGFDIACTNEWTTTVLVDPDDTTQYVSVGVLSQTSYPRERIALPGRTSLLAFKFICRNAGDATISSVAIHYDKEGAA